MLISVPIQTQVISTNVVESLPIYDEHATYVDKDLVQYDPRGGTDYAIYGVFNQTQPHSHHTFVYYSETAPNAVTDGKNYSKATAGYQMEYEVLGEGKFDTIAIGHVIADTISIEFIDPSGKVIYSVIDRVVDNRIDDKGRHPPLPVTEIFYCPVDMPHGSTVKVTLKMPGDMVVAGTLLLGLSVDAGFTHLVFENRFHDYSPTEEDQWGNITYIEGVKVNIHNGTVDIQLKNYDYMCRLMLAIGGKEVILNGYSSKSNKQPDNIHGDFYATMMIGRMKDFSLKTVVKNKRMDEFATYKVQIKEIV